MEFIILLGFLAALTYIMIKVSNYWDKSWDSELVIFTSTLPLGHDYDRVFDNTVAKYNPESSYLKRGKREISKDEALGFV